MSTEQRPKLNRDQVLETAKRVVGFMNIDLQVEVKEEPADNSGQGVVVVSIQTPNDARDARFLIGKNGQNLKALEHILRSMLVKNGKEGTIVVDVNDYKKSRALYLVEMAKQAVTRVRNTHKAEALSPMSSYERRVVHMELAAYPDIATESIGFEPQRRVIIKPYP